MRLNETAKNHDESPIENVLSVNEKWKTGAQEKKPAIIHRDQM